MIEGTGPSPSTKTFKPPSSLSGEQVDFEIKKMISFIKQESLEKAREIQLKAHEEFQIEKAKLVHQESQHLQEAFQKNVHAQQSKYKISQSVLVNEQRLRLQAEYAKCYQELVHKCKSGLEQLFKREKYPQYLHRALEECIERMQEEGEIVVRCRMQDVELVRGLIQQKEREMEKGNYKLSIDAGEYLDEDSLGGIVCVTPDGKISCSNRVEDKLERLLEHRMPEIRRQLFGE